MLCPKCKKQKQYHGFERRLITSGKNKGTYVLKEYYSCECHLVGAKTTEQQLRRRNGGRENETSYARP